jgi:transposase, IS5 family
MCEALRQINGYTGRAMRATERQTGRVTDNSLRQRIGAKVILVNRLLRQKQKDERKLYALHAPEVDCIAKGTASIRYEFFTEV